MRTRRVYISRIWGEETPRRIASKFCLVVGTQGVITCIKFGDDRLRGFWSAGCQSSPFPIDFDGRPYNSAYATACTVIIIIIFVLLDVETPNIWLSLVRARACTYVHVHGRCNRTRWFYDCTHTDCSHACARTCPHAQIELSVVLRDFCCNCTQYHAASAIMSAFFFKIWEI